MFWIKLIFKQKHMKYSPAMTLMINEGKKNPILVCFWKVNDIIICHSTAAYKTMIMLVFSF